MSNSVLSPRSPKYSVIIPTHDRAETLAGSLRSLDQISRRPDTEILVVDNASRDATAAVVDGCAVANVRYHRYDTLCSMYENHRRGVRHSRGDYVVFLHSDDSLPDDFLDRIDATLRRRDDQRVDIVADLNAYWNNPEVLSSVAHGDEFVRRANWAAALLIYNGCSPSGTVYRRGAFEDYGSFHPDCIVADTLLMIRWTTSGATIVDCAQRTPVWRVGEVSLSNQSSYQRGIHRSFEIRFKTAAEAVGLDGLRDGVMRLWPRVSMDRQLEFLYRCHVVGWRRLARQLWQSSEHRYQYLKTRKFYDQVLGSRYGPDVYHRFRPWLSRLVKV